MGSKPTSPGRDPSRVSGEDPKGRALVPSIQLALRAVETLPVWAGAKAAAEPRVAATIASFMLIWRIVFG
jgi:hypothetical protein